MRVSVQKEAGSAAEKDGGPLITAALWKFAVLVTVCRVEDFLPKTSKKVTKYY